MEDTFVNEAVKIKQKLIALRKEKNISQTEFAKLIGMKQSNLAKFEYESNPKFCNIIKYAKALGLKSIDF